MGEAEPEQSGLIAKGQSRHCNRVRADRVTWTVRFRGTGGTGQGGRIKRCGNPAEGDVSSLVTEKTSDRKRKDEIHRENREKL